MKQSLLTSVEQGLIEAGDWGVLKDYYLDCSRDDLVSLIDLPLEAITRWLENRGIIFPKRAYLEQNWVRHNYLRAGVTGAIIGHLYHVYDKLVEVEEGKIYLTLKNTIATRKTLFLALREFHESHRTRAY